MVSFSNAFEMNHNPRPLGSLYGIGVGPGDPELITMKALRVMRECDVIAIPGQDPSKRLAFEIAKSACPEIAEKEQLCIVTPMTKDENILNRGYQKAADSIIQQLDLGKNVGVLSLGDPTIYSTYIYIHRLVVAAGYEGIIINGVPSFCAVAAKRGDSLVDRDEKLHVIPASYDLSDSSELDGTKVYMKAGSRYSKLREMILSSDCEAYLIENCGMIDECIYSDKNDFPENVSYYSIVVVKD